MDIIYSSRDIAFLSCLCYNYVDMRKKRSPDVKVSKNPDQIDTDDRFFRRLSTRPMLYSQLYAVLIPGISAGYSTKRFNGSDLLSNASSEMLTTYPMCSALGAVAVGTVIYPNLRRQNAKQITESREEMDQLRSLIDEPIDTIRRRSEKKNQPLINELRWYGADSAWNKDSELEAGLLADRIRKVADFADEHEMSAVTMGTAWLKSHNIDTDPYGKTADGGSYMTASRTRLRAYSKKKRVRTTRIELYDDAVDATVLVSTPELLRNLADEIEKTDPNRQQNSNTAALEDIVDKLQDIKLTKLYRVYKAHQTDQALAQFTQYARVLLEEAIGSDNYHSYHMDHHGITIQRRSSTNSTVRGGKISRQVSWRGSDGSEGHGKGDDSTVLSWAGEQDLGSLLTHLDGKNRIMPGTPLRNKALAAAFLLTSELGNEYKAKGIKKSETDSEQVRSPLPTTMQLHEQSNLRGLIKLKYDGSDRLDYRYIRSNIRRKAGAIALLGAAIPTGMFVISEYSNMVGMASQAQYEHITQSLNTQGIDIEDPFYEELWQQEYTRQLGQRRLIFDVFEFIKDRDDTLKQKIMETYVKVFGEDFTNWISFGKYFSGYRGNIHALPLDSGAFPVSRNSIGAGIGDVPSKNRNVTAFMISSPTNESTNGMWYTDIYDSAGIIQGKGPLNVSFQYSNDRFNDSNVSRNFEILDLPWSEKDLANVSYDFDVATGYMHGPNGELSLPMIQGGTINAAFIMDKNDPTKRVQANVVRHMQSGTYRLNFGPDREETLRANHIKDPELHYYVQQTDRQTLFNTGGTEFGIYSDANIREIAMTVRNELGLSAFASDEQIYNAIKSKNYSFTPLADAGLEDNLISEDGWSTTNTVGIEVGRVLAHLESLNCNLASTLHLLATGGGGQDNLEISNGYANNGDNRLVNGEAHAWLMDKTGHVIDPTPARRSENGIYPNDTPPAMESKNYAKHWGAILVGAAMMIVAYRQRERLKQQALNVQSKIERTKIDFAEEMLIQPETAQAVGEITAAMYGRPGTMVSVAVPQQSELRRDISHIPDKASVKDIERRRAAQGQPLSPALKKSIRNVLKNRKHLKTP